MRKFLLAVPLLLMGVVPASAEEIRLFCKTETAINDLAEQYVVNIDKAWDAMVVYINKKVCIFDHEGELHIDVQSRGKKYTNGKDHVVVVMFKDSDSMTLYAFIDDTDEGA